MGLWLSKFASFESPKITMHLSCPLRNFTTAFSWTLLSINSENPTMNFARSPRKNRPNFEYKNFTLKSNGSKRQNFLAQEIADPVLTIEGYRLSL
jgi:hypothetical protein